MQSIFKVVGIKRIIGLCCLGLVSGCSNQFVSHDALVSDPQASRYAIEQDRAPDVALAPESIALTTPRKEPLSRGGNKSPYTVNGKQYHIMASAEGYAEEGIASWYGVKFHGHKTSNGEVFDMNAISAAHKTLPLPTWVRVTNLDNGKSIDVRVNDRGPFHGGRIIDLSYAAAVKLGFQDKGTARVRVETVKAAYLDLEAYLVQVGVFSEKDRAVKVRDQLVAQLQEEVKVYQSDLYRVRIGPVSYDRAVELQNRFENTELGRPLIVAIP